MKLVGLAGLEADFGAARGANPALASYWGVVKDWKETSRYDETRAEAEARMMFEAVKQAGRGVRMDPVTVADEQIKDGRRLLDRLVQNDVPVRAACWVKPSDEDRWSLYLVTPLVDERGPVGAYREVYGQLRSLGGLAVTDTDVKLVGEGQSVGKDLLELVRRHSGARAVRGHRPWLAGTPIDDVYVYPTPSSKPKRGDGHPPGTMKVRLKDDVEQVFRDDEVREPLTAQEEGVMKRIVSSGVSPAQAEYFVRKRRAMDRQRLPIRAGTVVDAWVAAWWGDSPEDDPNPLLEIEAPGGARGLTFKDNTEPV